MANMLDHFQSIDFFRVMEFKPYLVSASRFFTPDNLTTHYRIFSEYREANLDMVVDIEALRLLVYETAWKTGKGMTGIYEPSRDKAFIDLVFEKLARTGMEILGDFSQVDPMYKGSEWTKIQGAIEHIYWNAPGFVIAAGTTHTQKNIVGQFGLGLPRSY